MAKRESANTNRKTSRSRKTAKRLTAKKEMLAAKKAKSMRGRSKTK